MSKAASAQRTLKVPPGIPDAVEDRRAAEKRQDAADAAAVELREAERKADDRIGQVEAISHAPCEYDRTPTQLFGADVIAHFGGVDKIPHWFFTRHYFSLGIVIDTFDTQAQYDRADVGARRAFVRHFGARYAALGPNHTRYPHEKEEMRRLYPSLVEQLERE